jgi:3-hydroxymyristoyl/3-hydroxydecanoyl-(acyl carrier protein) dehydratase
MTRIPLSIAGDHPAFAGHFPGRPIVPGVVLLDACLRALGGTATRIASAKFLSMVLPGEAVRLEVENNADAGPCRVRVYAGAVDVERLAMSATVDFEASR